MRRPPCPSGFIHSCAATRAALIYASKGSLDTVFEAVPRLSLMVLLLSRFAARIPTLCCTNITGCVYDVLLLACARAYWVCTGLIFVRSRLYRESDLSMMSERRARWYRCSLRPWAPRVTSPRPPQALKAIFYLVEAVYRRPHGVCARYVPHAARVPSLASWLRRGAAQEQPWGAFQRLAGWRRAWQAYLADLPGWRQSTGPCAAALSVSDDPSHNKICGVVVVRFWSRPWDCRISVNFRF